MPCSPGAYSLAWENHTNVYDRIRGTQVLRGNSQEGRVQARGRRRLGLTVWLDEVGAGHRHLGKE